MAQEHSFGKEEISNNNESGSDHHANEADHPKAGSMVQDTMPVMKSPPLRARSKNSESTASQHSEAAKYNFLYFIFEKFKITDIIE